MANDWVTGPALQILIQQRGMRVGDRIKIQLCPCADGKHGAPGDEKFVGEDLEVVLALGGLLPGDLIKVKSGTTLPDRVTWRVLSTDDDESYPVNLIFYQNTDFSDPDNWDDCCHFRDIVAWRRPVRRKA